MWFWILVVFVVGGAILGFFSSDDNEKGSGCLGGALMGLLEGGGCLIQLLIYGIIIFFALMLFGAVFG